MEQLGGGGSFLHLLCSIFHRRRRLHLILGGYLEPWLMMTNYQQQFHYGYLLTANVQLDLKHKLLNCIHNGLNYTMLRNYNFLNTYTFWVLSQSHKNSSLSRFLSLNDPLSNKTAATKTDIDKRWQSQFLTINGKIEDFIRNIIIYYIHGLTRNENHGKCRLKMWTGKNRPWTSVTFGISFNVDTVGECSVKYDLIAFMSSFRKEWSSLCMNIWIHKPKRLTSRDKSS